MADIDITVDDITAFEAGIEDMVAWCISMDGPLKIMGSYSHDDQKSVLLASHWNGRTTMNALRSNFKMGDNVFGYSAEMEQRLLDMGCLIDDKYVRGATHIIEIAHGTWAGTGEPVWNKYRVKMDDIDATLAAIKYGGRLKKI